ncbi:MAG: hypothetical protein Q9181_004593 [Wetmoreana brouardii]
MSQMRRGHSWQNGLKAVKLGGIDRWRFRFSLGELTASSGARHLARLVSKVTTKLMSNLRGQDPIGKWVMTMLVFSEDGSRKVT